MFDLPKPILAQLLSAFNTRKDTLSSDEQMLASRICFCTLCDYIWVRRLKREPDRCPSCHRRGWNMPLVNAMLERVGDNLTSTVVPQKALGEAPSKGAE
jgi:predicted Zn-ribbon and HTH transcriptional regulator